jgi:hypothetical protein
MSLAAYLTSITKPIHGHQDLCRIAREQHTVLRIHYNISFNLNWIFNWCTLLTDEYSNDYGVRALFTHEFLDLTWDLAWSACPFSNTFVVGPTIFTHYTSVRAVKPLVAFYDSQGSKAEVLFFCSVPHITSDHTYTHALFPKG